MTPLLLLLALTVSGNDYPPTATADGKTLHLVGAGVREKTVFDVDVYTMGVYTETKTCEHEKLVATDEAKRLRLDFVRDVPADKMKAALRESFGKKTPKTAPATLKGQIDGFLELFQKELVDGTSVVVTYVPGKGTTVTVDGKKRGAVIPGQEFQKVLWAIYFEKEICCPNLLKGIDKTCKRR